MEKRKIVILPITMCAYSVSILFHIQNMVMILTRIFPLSQC